MKLENENYFIPFNPRKQKSPRTENKKLEPKKMSYEPNFTKLSGRSNNNENTRHLRDHENGTAEFDKNKIIRHVRIDDKYQKQKHDANLHDYNDDKKRKVKYKHLEALGYIYDETEDEENKIKSENDSEYLCRAPYQQRGSHQNMRRHLRLQPGMMTPTSNCIFERKSQNYNSGPPSQEWEKY